MKSVHSYEKHFQVYQNYQRYQRQLFLREQHERILLNQLLNPMSINEQWIIFVRIVLHRKNPIEVHFLPVVNNPHVRNQSHWMNSSSSLQGLSAAIINMNPLINERHISFVVNNENDSNESRHTTIVMNDEDGNIPENRGQKSKLMRRNSAKSRKLSVRTKEKSQ